MAQKKPFKIGVAGKGEMNARQSGEHKGSQMNENKAVDRQQKLGDQMGKGELKSGIPNIKISFDKVPWTFILGFPFDPIHLLRRL